MTDATLYMSQQYNPHSLDREWGFILAKKRPALIKSQDLQSARIDLAKEIVDSYVPLQSDHTLPAISGAVKADGIDPDPKVLIAQVGTDIVRLALLADVPLHRPIRITHNSLVGHWRWLRQVWTCFWYDTNNIALSATSTTATPNTLTGNPPDNITGKIISDTRHHIETGRFHTAIAALHQQFQAISLSDKASEISPARLSFLQDLTLFCPFIGTELLYRHGYAPNGPGHQTKDSEE
ncbi:hypothetical protein [Thalassospira alkalitolerans]|uniref:hypothetical protein n=1 Tax=Thalassospira alkalitolerans TaxID=1293890 RepID=UPI003AA81FA6